MNYGDLGKRILASIVDSFIVTLGSSLVGFLLGLIFSYAGVIIVICIVPWIPFLYYVLMEGSSWHATVGKHMMGLYVGDENGEGIPYSTAILRTICKVFSGLFFGIGYLMGFFNPPKQCLHDMMAKTYVLEGRPRIIGYGYDGVKGVPELVCVKGPLAGATYQISDGGLLIGRDSVSCQVVLPSSQQNISRIHCFVTYNQISGMYILNDRNSSYGTYLANGSKVMYNKPAALRRGEMFYLVSPDNTFEVR